MKKSKFLILCLILMNCIFLFKLNYIKATSDSSPPKNIYLTFDDGPTYVITNKLLNILSEKGVKATFFIVGKEIEGKEDILKRIYAEGHSIGLHTYSHNFKQIYKSDEIFIEEMLKTQAKIKEITGFTSNLIRFPGGSSKRLNLRLLDKLHEHNLKIYDWNVNLCDGVNPNLTTNQLFVNGTKHNTKYSRLIILMHCNFNNINTVNALPKIIDHYKNLGYEFKVIDENTKEYYYRLKK